MKRRRSDRSADRERLAAEEYRRWTPVLEAFIAREFRTLSHAERAEVRDAAWEDLMRHRSRKGHGGYDTPIGYLRRAALSHGISLRRAQRQRRTDPADPADWVFIAPGGDVAEEAHESLDEERLRAALMSLPVEERSVLFLRAFVGLGASATRSALRMTLKRYELVHARALDRMCDLYVEGLESPVFAHHRRALARTINKGRGTNWKLQRARKLASESARATPGRPTHL